MSRSKRRLLVSLAVVAIGAGAVAAVLPAVPTPSPHAAVVLVGVSSADAKQIQAFYSALGDIVVRDGSQAQPLIPSVFALRELHRKALVLAFVNTQMVGKYPSLGQALDDYLLSAVGDTDIPLTPDLRGLASQKLKAIR